MKIKKMMVLLGIFCLIILLTPTSTFAAKSKPKKNNKDFMSGGELSGQEVEQDYVQKSASDTSIDDIIKDMKDVNDAKIDTSSGIGKVINTVIRLIQVAGSGIALIMVTILGTKYMVASSNEKADIKKQAVPIVIGCTLLFVAVNIVAIIADMGLSLNS